MYLLFNPLVIIVSLSNRGVEMKPLAKHIEDRHGGNKSRFARSVGWWPQNINRKIEAGWGVTEDGYLVPPDAKRDMTGVKNGN